MDQLHYNERFGKWMVIRLILHRVGGSLADKVYCRTPAGTEALFAWVGNQLVLAPCNAQWALSNTVQL
jgi:hypothetical protein